MNEKLNLIVIMLDTMRYDMVNHVGADFIKTPNMDRLARESIIFDNCFAEGLPTLPVRRAMFTGMRSFPWRFDEEPSGMWPTLRGWHRIPSNHTTIAEILLKAGYTTGLVGDTLHMFKMGGNFQRGFSSYDWIRGQESDSYRTGPLSAVDLPKYSKPGAAEQQLKMLTQYLLNIQDRRGEDDYFAARVFSRAERWLEDNIDNGPFFLWVDSFDPHEPWDPPPGYADQYAPSPGGPELIQAGAQDCETDGERERVKALYYGEVTFVDKCVGRFLDKIDALGLRDNSIVMLVSDHGTQLFEHGGLHKAGVTMFPWETQLLWFIRHPMEDRRDQHVEGFVQDHDLFPTALRLLGLEHGPMDGRDAWTLTTGDCGGLRDHVITGFQDFASVRDNEWNYIIDFASAEAKPRLFNHLSDPHERRNVSSEHPDVLARQQARLEQLLGQSLPAKLPDRTYPTNGPYHEQYANHVTAGRM
jgi:arylsulfatase A-like enzyme